MLETYIQRWEIESLPINPVCMFFLLQQVSTLKHVVKAEDGSSHQQSKLATWVS